MAKKSKNTAKNIPPQKNNPSRKFNTLTLIGIITGGIAASISIPTFYYSGMKDNYESSIQALEAIIKQKEQETKFLESTQYNNCLSLINSQKELFEIEKLDLMSQLSIFKDSLINLNFNTNILVNQIDSLENAIGEKTRLINCIDLVKSALQNNSKYAGKTIIYGEVIDKITRKPIKKFGYSLIPTHQGTVSGDTIINGIPSKYISSKYASQFKMPNDGSIITSNIFIIPLDYDAKFSIDAFGYNSRRINVDKKTKYFLIEMERTVK